MIHEKLLIRPDGTKYKLCVSISIGILNTDRAHYAIELFKCLPRKRKFIRPIDEDSYSFRKLGFAERQQNIKNQLLTHVTQDEIYEVKMELWEKLKPEL